MRRKTVEPRVGDGPAMALKSRHEPSARPPFGAALADGGWMLTFIVLVAWLGYRNYVAGQPHVSILEFGPLRLSTFGLFVALDIVFGYYLVRLWCLRFGLDWKALGDRLVWIVLVGLYLSHLVSVAAYYPQDLLDWRVLIDPRSRISSFGGMFGGGLVAVWLLRRAGLEVLLYADALVYGFTGGYVFGRLGCFSVHDHPGRETTFALGYHDGALRRHDLGLYEMFLMLALVILMSWVARRRAPQPGTLLALACLLYAPVRFTLDGLRVADVTYLGLTPGQWFCLPLFLIGLAVSLHLLRSARQSSV